MNMKKIALLVLVLCACFALTIGAAGSNFGEFDVFETEQTTETPTEETPAEEPVEEETPAEDGVVYTTEE